MSGFALLLITVWPWPASTAAPANDNFANADVLYGVTNLAVSNVGATAEPGEPAHAGESASHSLWWKWTAPFTGSFSITTSNSLTDTLLAVYSGTSLSNLDTVIANDDTEMGWFGATWSDVAFRAYAGETLWIAVDSFGTNSGTIRLKIDRAGWLAQPWQAPDLQGQPVYSTNYAGQVLLVDAWETTCGACVEEMPNLIRLQSRLQSYGFTLLGLSGDPKPGLVTDFLEGRGVNYPIAMITPAIEGTVFGGPVGFPTKALVDREGRVAAIYSGPHDVAYYMSIALPLLRTDSRVRVRVTRAGDNVRISWPAPDLGYSVEAASSLTDGRWSPLTAAVVLTNAEYILTVPANAAAQFFRLKKP